MNLLAGLKFDFYLRTREFALEIIVNSLQFFLVIHGRLLLQILGKRDTTRMLAGSPLLFTLKFQTLTPAHYTVI